MARKKNKSVSSLSGFNLAQALGEAAVNLQRAAYSEDQIARVFQQQMNACELRGGLTLLDETGEYLVVKSAAEEGRFQKILSKLETAIGISARGFKFAIADVDVYSQVLETSDAVFVPDSSVVLEQIIPEIAKPIAGRIILAFGGHPGIYAPLISQGKVRGVLNIFGEALSENDMPSVRAFAGHIAATLDNAQLYENLKESEQHFRSIIENATIGFYQTHPDGHILLANPAMIKMLGFSSFEELSKRNLEREGYALGYSREDFRKKLEEEGQIAGLETAWVREDGNILYIRESARVVRDSKGKVLFYEGTVEDITERKLAEDALKVSETRFRSLIEQSPISTILYKPDGSTIFGNTAATKLWNIQPKILEQIYQNYNIFQDQQLIEKGLMPYIERGFAGEYVETPPVIYESVSTDKTYVGSKRWIKATIYPVKDQDDVVREVVLMQEDISESILADEVLRENEERYRHIFETSAVSLWEEDFSEVIADMDALLDQGVEDLRAYLDEHPDFLAQAALKIKILDVNETTLKMLGASSKAELLGSLDKIYLDDTGEILKEELLAIAEGRTYFEGETVNQTLQGEIKNILLTMAIPPEREKLSNVLVSVMDITRRVQAEDRLKRQLTELGVLKEVASAGIEAKDEDQLIAQATQIIGQSLYPQNFGVLLIDENLGEIRPHSSYYGVPEHATNLSVPVGSGSITGKVADTGEAILVPDIRLEPEYLNVVDDTQSELVVPLKIGSRVIGVINSESVHQGYFSEDDLRLLTTVAGQLSTAIERLRNDAAEREQRQFNRALISTSTAINSTFNIDEIFEQLLESVLQVVPYDEASIMVIEGDTVRTMRQRFNHTPGMVDKVLGKCFQIVEFPSIMWMIKNKRALVVSDTAKNDMWIQRPEDNWIGSYLAAPILDKGEIIGLINLDHSQADFYSNAHSERLQAFSDQAAIAIQNARLYQDALEDAERRLVLYNASQEMIMASRDPKVVYEAIHHAVKNVMQVDAFLISLVHDVGGEIKLAYAVEKGERIPEQYIPPGSGVSGYVIDNGVSIYIKDMNTYDRDFDVHKIGDPEYIQSLVAVPLQISGRTIGVISAQSHTPNAYTPDDLYLLEMLGAHAAAVLENGELYNSAIDDARRWAALHSVSQEVVAASQDLDSAYQALHKATQRMMPVDVFVISLLNVDLNEIELVYAFDGDERAPATRVPKDTGLSGYVINKGEPIMLSDLAVNEIDFEILRFGRPGHIRSMLAVPIRIKGDVFGMISAQSYQVNTYSDGDKFNLEMLASLAAAVLENTNLYDQAQRRLDELEAIGNITSALREAASVEEMLPILLDQIALVIGSAFGAIHLTDPVSGNLVAKEWNPPHPDLVGLSHPPGEGVTGHVAKTWEIYLSEDLMNDPIAKIHPEEADFFKDVRANITLPLLATDNLVGVMNIGLPKGRSYRDEEIDLLTSIAHIAANAIRRATLHEKTQLSLQRLSALREIDQAITESLDLNFTLSVLIDQVISQLKVDAVGVLLFNPHTLMLEYGAGAGFRSAAISQAQVRIDQGFAGRAALERKLIQIPSILETRYESSRQEALLSEGFVSYFGAALSAKGNIVGVLEIFHRQQLDPDREWIDFLETLAGQVAIAINNAMLFQDLQRANLNLSLAYDRTLEGWARALELRDQETEGHSRRVTEMTVQLSRKLGMRNDQLVHVRRGSLLHDIGKMGVPDRILLKEGPLNDKEWQTMRQHPNYAYEMLSLIEYLAPSLDIPRYHHEKWDGSGYPQGFKNTQIPLSARIFAVVDVWDALRSDRPYRDAWPDDEVAEYIKEQAGSHFDPQIVDAFMSIWQPNGQKT